MHSLYIQQSAYSVNNVTFIILFSSWTCWIILTWNCTNVYLPPISFSFYQYYYSVRVFAGQEPSGVWVGWITPDYHQYDPHFDMSKVRNVTVTVGDDKGNIHDRYV